MDLSIIIVNYNTEVHLQECLNSIFQFTKNINFEVIVVDNNSPRNDIENFPLLFPAVKFYFRNINDGFGAGCNYGVRKANGKYYLFFNPDIILNNNAVYDFFDFMEKNKDVGLCSGLLTDSHGNFQYTYNFFPSITWEFREAISRTTDKKINQLLNEFTKNQSLKVFEVDWVMGACMFIRAELFNQLKGFDESLFLYYEDVDLQYRLSKLGHRIVVLRDVKLKHHQRSSIDSKNGDDVYFYNMHKSKMKYMYKHFNFWKRNFIRLLFIIGMILRLVTIPFRKENSAYTFKQAFTVLNMYIYIYKFNR